MINETRTFFPSQKEYLTFVNRTWDKIWLTNRDKLTLELKSKLKNHLKINNISITTNGIIALLLSGNQGEIINDSTC